MAIYKFTAKSFRGDLKSGDTEAGNEKELAEILRNEGYILISAVEKKKKRAGLNFNLGKVSIGQKLMLTRNLRVMIASGVSLPRALQTLSDQTGNKIFKKALEDIKKDILKGENLSQSIEKHPKIFSDLFCSMVRVGEETGSLDKSLLILSQYLERSHQVRSKVKGALMYPIVVVSAMIIIGIVMLIKVVPQLNEAFISMGVDLPPLTKMIIGAGEFMAKNWHFIFFIFLLLIFAFNVFKRREAVRKIKDKIFIKIPIFKNLIKKINTAYAARTLSSLISGGVSIVETLKIASSSVNNFSFQSSLLLASDAVKKGKKLSEIMSEFSDLYSPVFIQMLQVGEETGKTSEILSQLADFLEEEVTSAAQNLSSIIEPALLLIVGAVIGVFAVSMIQPIYSMMRAL